MLDPAVVFPTQTAGKLSKVKGRRDSFLSGPCGGRNPPVPRQGRAPSPGLAGGWSRGAFPGAQTAHSGEKRPVVYLKPVLSSSWLLFNVTRQPGSLYLLSHLSPDLRAASPFALAKKTKQTKSAEQKLHHLRGVMMARGAAAAPTWLSPHLGL